MVLGRLPDSNAKHVVELFSIETCVFRDFFFLKRQDADIIIRVLIALIQEKLPRYVEAKPFDIQVLTPMRKGLLGVERLNQILQGI